MRLVECRGSNWGEIGRERGLWVEGGFMLVWGVFMKLLGMMGLNVRWYRSWIGIWGEWVVQYRRVLEVLMVWSCYLG